MAFKINDDNLEIVILAAGPGSRMGDDMPKALTKLSGKTFIDRIIETVKPLSRDPVIVVGHRGREVKEHLGSSFRFAHQHKLLGTGHALMCAKPQIDSDKENLLVLYADMPLVKKETALKLVALRESEDALISMATVLLPDFKEHRRSFVKFGRILRDKDGEIAAIKEFKDASPKERSVKEVNPAFFCFKSSWLWKHIPLLKTDTFKKEYYLTDMVGIARAQRGKISSFEIDPTEALGANTPEDLNILENFVS